MTYKKLAELAGVSSSTVSKVFSGNHEISEATAERILKLAEQYNVVPPKYYKSRTGLRVAIIVPEIISVFYSSRATEIAAELEKYGVLASVHISGFDDGHASELIDSLIDSRVDGIISIDTLCGFKADAPPMVCTNGAKTGNRADTVSLDVYSLIYEAVEYLKELGHTDIGFVGERYTENKLKLFRQAAAVQGLDIAPRHVFMSDKRFEQIGYEAAERFISKKTMPTAFLCAYDEIAMGMLHAFKLHGITVPEDVSLIGINDIPFASYAETPLTTLVTYNNEMARTAVQLLMDKINAPNNRVTRTTVIKGELIVRNTTAKPRDKKAMSLT